MASIARPPMESHSSSQSSPPPSPVHASFSSSPTTHRHPIEASSPQPLDINTTIFSPNKVSSRPRLPGRQETPPSPPNSMVLGDLSPVSRAMQSSSSPVAPTNQRMALQELEHQDRTPPPSLKQRITRVFKVGHKRAESDLSRSTMSTNDDTTHQDTSGYMPSPLKENESSYQRNSTTYARKTGATSIRPIMANYFSNNAGPAKRVIMNGGEVRVEIRPGASLMGEDSKSQGNTPQRRMKTEDGSVSYDKYYTQASREADEQFNKDYEKEEEEEVERPSETRSGVGKDAYLPPLDRNTSTPQRNQTVNSNGSAASRERRYVEESVSFGFEGFHIGSGSVCSDGPHAEGLSPTGPGAFYSNSGKASSSVLNYINQSELNILSRNPSSGKSISAVGRPGVSRNASSTSYFSPGTRRAPPAPGASPGAVQLDEAVARELKRLSKISAGSGASGFAMVITADGAASTRLEEDFSDEELDRITERKFTKEEKGKGKAESSVVSEGITEHKGGDSRNGNQEKGHQHTASDFSEFISGNHSHHSSQNGDSDGTTELLKKIDGGNPRRKLKSQEVQKDMLVHEGDARYDFIYRIRQTSDAAPILVPQYFYPNDGAFPNRNALSSPIRAKFSPVSPINTSAMSFGGQYNSSPIAKPQDAYTRSPDSSHSYYRMHGGDQAFDSPIESPRYPYASSDGYDSHRGSMTHSHSENKMESLVHPALRNGGDGHPSERGRSRAVVSMGSLEGITGFGMGRLVTGTPNGTGRRLAGSSLADTSDLNITQDSPVKRVRMSGVDQIALVSPLVQHNPTEPRRGQKKGIKVPRSGLRLPRRPKDLRRSMTPRLYDPRPLGDSWRDLATYNPEDWQDDGYTREYRAKEKRASMTILALCVLFPPLFLLAAMGAFDTTVDGWTNGEVKRIGRVEKRVAAVAGGIFAVAAVVGGVVATVLVT